MVHQQKTHSFAYSTPKSNKTILKTGSETMALKEHMMVLLEKFDIQRLSENLNTLGAKMEHTNNNLTGNVRAIEKIQKKREASADEPKELSVDRNVSAEFEQLRNELELSKKENLSLKSSNEFSWLQ